MQFKLPARMRNLEGAINLTGPRGMCFHRSVAFVLDVPQATLMVGTIPAPPPEILKENSEFSDVDFIHAWPEVAGFVFPPSWMEKSGTMRATSKLAYYSEHQPYDIKQMSRFDLKKLAEEWGFSKHFSRFTPLKDNASFGGVIMNALGIEYTVTSDGGVVPNESVPMSRV
jgi:hypothetical protein